MANLTTQRLRNAPHIGPSLKITWTRNGQPISTSSAMDIISKSMADKFGKGAAAAVEEAAQEYADVARELVPRKDNLEALHGITGPFAVSSRGGGAGGGHYESVYEVRFDDQALYANFGRPPGKAPSSKDPHILAMAKRTHNKMSSRYRGFGFFSVAGDAAVRAYAFAVAQKIGREGTEATATHFIEKAKLRAEALLESRLQALAGRP